MTIKNVLKWENTAHITKMSIESTVATASLAAAITTVLIATKVIAGPASLALIASPAGIAVLFIAAVYFAAAAYASYQQMHAIENAKGEKGENGKDGANGKDADFSVLLGDVVKSGAVVEENQKLNLKLSKDDYQALTNDKKGSSEVVLHVLSEGKSVEVKFKYVDVANDNDNYKLELTSVDSKDQLADMKKELYMTDSNSLKVAVSYKDLESLKNGVSTKLGEFVVNAAISKVIIGK
ncbi:MULTISPECIES: hypothetical protein [unclassified Wolbachia]|uniref:hypothetical protein n=1 Tax=unclassified Wolbachia TaxID=2640676 RepID=UPI002227D8D5|nr:hypothetical protein [Wolbachia endosymbiont (group B) of Euphydryas aurinia]